MFNYISIKKKNQGRKQHTSSQQFQHKQRLLWLWTRPRILYLSPEEEAESRARTMLHETYAYASCNTELTPRGMSHSHCAWQRGTEAVGSQGTDPDFPNHTLSGT